MIPSHHQLLKRASRPRHATKCTKKISQIYFPQGKRNSCHTPMYTPSKKLCFSSILMSSINPTKTHKKLYKTKNKI